MTFCFVSVFVKAIRYTKESITDREWPRLRWNCDWLRLSACGIIASRTATRQPDAEDDGPPFACSKSDELYADPNSFKRFYLCDGFHAYSQACPPSLYFDDKLKFCTFKTAQLQCGPVEEDEEQEKASTNQDKLTICDKRACQLPNCFCSDEGTAIPGRLQYQTEKGESA